MSIQRSVGIIRLRRRSNEENMKIDQRGGKNWKVYKNIGEKISAVAENFMEKSSRDSLTHFFGYITLEMFDE